METKSFGYLCCSGTILLQMNTNAIATENFIFFRHVVYSSYYKFLFMLGVIGFLIFIGCASLADQNKKEAKQKLEALSGNYPRGGQIQCQEWHEQMQELKENTEHSNWEPVAWLAILGLIMLGLPFAGSCLMSILKQESEVLKIYCESKCLPFTQAFIATSGFRFTLLFTWLNQ